MQHDIYVGFVCTRGGGCSAVRLKPLNLDDALVRSQTQQFALAYQEAVKGQRDPGTDREVLRLLQLITQGTGQPRLPGF